MTHDLCIALSYSCFNYVLLNNSQLTYLTEHYAKIRQANLYEFVEHTLKRACERDVILTFLTHSSDYPVIISQFPCTPSHLECTELDNDDLILKCTGLESLATLGMIIIW